MSVKKPEVSTSESEDEPERPEDQMGSTATRIFMVFIIILGGHFSSVGVSIRYGFLAVSFTKRDIPGQMFGFVEGSIFFGYMTGYFCSPLWNKLKAGLTPKWVLAISVGLQGLCVLVSGLADLTDNNHIFICLSTLARMLLGFIAFPQNVCCLDLLKSLFPNKFDLLTGLIQMGYFSGHGVGEFVGTALYDRFGYRVPFIYPTSGLLLLAILSLLFLPTCPSIAVTYDKEMKRNDPGEPTEKTSLSSMVVFPAFACMLINGVYAYLQIATTPYLYDKFNIPLTVGGMVLVTVSAGNAIGCIISGTIAQSKIIHSYTQMIIGAAMVGIGLLLMFPRPSFEFIYNNVPYLSYPASLISGIGDSIITIPTLRAMTDLQTMTKGKCTGKNEVSIFGIWMMGTACSTYSGALFGGALMQYLSYVNAAYLLASMCCVSIITSQVIKIVINIVYKRGSNDERVYLLSRSI